MSEPPFDLAAHGLESHYTTDQQLLIRRLMLEDWKQVGVKLPTYMKLVARYIIPDGIPEAWIKKLSHQTMGKMLTGESTPRHAFWACLHFYLNKKYGDTGIVSTAPDDVEILGKALNRFMPSGDTLQDPMSWQISEQTIAYTHTPESQSYVRVGMVSRFQLDEPFAEPVFTSFEGAGLIQGGVLLLVLKDIAEEQMQYAEWVIDDAELAEVSSAADDDAATIYAGLHARAKRIAGAGE